MRPYQQVVPSFDFQRPSYDNVPKIEIRPVSSIRVGDISALAASIGRVGLINPITIASDGLLLAGARRLAAVKQLGWRTVPVIVWRSRDGY
jgi:ParB-like chromosome segregation protein Spo0J